VRNSTDLRAVELIGPAGDRLDDVAQLAEQLAEAIPGRESELQRLLFSRVTLNHMVEFSALLDTRGTMWDVNETALLGTGHSRREIHGKPFWEARWWIGSPAANQRLREAIDRAASGEFVSYDVEVFGAAGNDKILILDFSIKPVQDRLGVIRFLICEGRDVTERRRLEGEVERQRLELEQDELRRRNETLELQVAERTAELQAKQARLRTIFETSYTNQGLLDLDGTLLDVNSTALAGVASQFEDVVGKPFWETPWFTGTPGVSDMVRDAIPLVAAGETARQEIYIHLPVGGWRYYDFQMRPVCNDQGIVVALVAEAVELTGRRQAEEALRQAQKMEAIGQLTGGVAHDFNNLLQVIFGNLDSLFRLVPETDTNPLSANVRRLAHGAMRGAKRAAALTAQLLAFSRRQPLDPKPTDINRLVGGMSELLRRTLGENIVIETVTAGGLWRVNVDPNQLESTILNLAVNSRDAMPDGGNLTIETANAHLDELYAARQDEVIPGQYVVVSITDTGRGMSKEVSTRAFEPFFTTKEIGQGTGLGLSQVYGFVKQSGGHVKIYSESDQGTTVKIYLPRMHAADVGLAAAESAPMPPRGDSSETILVVEDDEDVRVHSTEMLRELGYRTLEAGAGQEALRILRAHPEIQLLFTDVGLPGGMNGRQLADQARASRNDLKVLFTTGYARNAIVHDGRLDPGVQLITKPFTYAALASKVRSILDTRSKPTRILLVEDDLSIQEAVAEVLGELGFKIETAGSATEALNKLKIINGEVEAAIIDVGLPGKTGDVLATELRTIYPSLPIVIASGYGEQTLQSRLTITERVAFLRKPYSTDQLQSALTSVIAPPS
jgi:PAS domain S-box-containing protein